MRGIGEKFAANPVNGTGTVSVPVATSPGRSGFGPQLELSYDSGAGNGPFGYGWTLSAPAITRRTDRGLPRYHDGDESDVFLLSGAEDLVPLLDADGDRVEDIDTAPGYRIHTYRPRTEGLFARIERWTSVMHPEDVHWRSLSRDNVLTVYGRDATSRVADPDDPRRIFSWRISESRDDKGNAIVYGYTPENGSGVDMGVAHERNRDAVRGTDVVPGTNSYLRNIRYGNREPLLITSGPGTGRRPRFVSDAEFDAADWCFEVVFDYGDHDQDRPTPLPVPGKPRPSRLDPFSTYRPGFEVRTYRLCRRILMFHHFEHEPDVGIGCLVRSTDLTYRETPVASFVTSVTQHGYRRAGNGYLRRSLPALEFTYSEATIDDRVHEVDVSTLENLPVGVDGTTYSWVDLDSEAMPGVISQQAGAWYYWANDGDARLGPVQVVARRPSTADLGAGRQQFLDLAGDGSLDLVEFDGPLPGFHERTADRGWAPFRPFRSLPTLAWDDPNLQFVDLDGDGHVDLFRLGCDASTWHRSLGEDGFGEAVRVPQPSDEERGPRLVHSDNRQQILLADMSGDGLTDLVRVRRNEICYWPNLGFGRFGAKVTMDNAPVFDTPDQFDPQRLRSGDVDGSGHVDMFYLGRDGVRLYVNQAGNSWSDARPLSQFPDVDNLTHVAVTDLLGDGTACLVWSSPRPHDGGRQMRYIDLMSGTKPHLLIRTANNLGAETRVSYAPSTRFYLQDKHDGNPWITRLPFPVHVIDRVETYDHISRNRFVTRYAYHHPYFDGVEREPRGFAMVESWNTENFASFSTDGALPAGDNADPASHVPPVHTKTWFHVGAPDPLPTLFAGDLDAPELPTGLTDQERREAFRALKGSMLRQEIYADDGTSRAGMPYLVTEQTYTVRMLQPRHGNQHAVFLTHTRETLTHHYERNTADPQISHTLALEVDPFGNVLKEAGIAYGRATSPLAHRDDHDRQTTTLVTYTENTYTDSVTGDDHRTPLPAETRTYELTGYPPSDTTFRPPDFVIPDPDHPGRLQHRFDTERDYTDLPCTGRQRRLIEQVRTLYRADDLTSLLDLGGLEPRALPGEAYRLAFTTDLIEAVYERPRPGQATEKTEKLVPDPETTLGHDGGYVDLDGDGRWWIPTGRTFHSPATDDSAAQELTHARQHFFHTQRYRDPFGHTTTITFDDHDLLMRDTCDPLGNRITVGERTPAGDIDTTKPGNDYRVLQPAAVMDPNRNRAQVAFDALGMVVGTAVLGKPEETVGDTLAGFVADLPEATLLDHLDDPLADPLTVLGGASTRLLYDVTAFERTGNRPAVACTMARETHHSAPGGRQTAIQQSFAYSDGFSQQIQVKSRAESGPVPRRDATGEIVLDADGLPKMTSADVSPRWVGTGWTIFNNKGKPVRHYEPFFSDTHRFEFGVRVGISPVVFYDPLDRVVATLHPNHTYEKVVFDAWQQVAFDVNDTVAAHGAETGDPRTDPDIRGYVAAYFTDQPPHWQTWRAQRLGTALGATEQAAATAAAVHADTPTTVHLDPLGRPFLTIARNRFIRAGTPVDEEHPTCVALDIEGNQRSVRDPLDRVIMTYDHDLLGNRIHHNSVDAGRRWTLNDATGKPIRAWDSRGHAFRTEYDALRRPVQTFTTGLDPGDPATETLTDRLVYGEQHPGRAAGNLRGRVCLQFDQAGMITTEQYDFKGNPMTSVRRITTEYRGTVRWEAVDTAIPPADTLFDPAQLSAALTTLVEAETFASATTYDALNRTVTIEAPDASVIRPGYNEANLLNRIDANLQGPVDGAGEPVWSPFVTEIDYDAKGQRTRIVYGSGATADRDGVTTTYTYDRRTFRLTQLTTRRDPAVFPDDCPASPVDGWPGCQIQDLHYTYDPVGNITHVVDTAQQAVFFRNKRVEPGSSYTYDAGYRVIMACGREHLGQTGAAVPYTSDDSARSGALHPEDGQAMATYVETYSYDAAGNISLLRHSGSDSANAGWQRAYTYQAGTNRLNTTMLNGINPLVEQYRHDLHGNITRMPHLGGTDPSPNMHWDHHDQLRQVDLGGGGTVFYTYDSAGQRVRKVWEKAPGLVEERIYVGPFEVFRSRDGQKTLRFERQTLHVSDDQRRIALVETRTVDLGRKDTSPEQLIRYQIANHQESSHLELDATARIISYEEYSPYGSTTYQWTGGQTETPKRYRFTGKERDGETGLSYHGARYYAPWLGRWASCDPALFVDGTNLYAYVGGNPVRFHDSSGLGADEQSLGASMEKASEEHQVLANELRELFGLEPVEVARREGVGNAPLVIPDEVKSMSGQQLVAETKARHIASAYNKLDAARRADVREGLNQVVEQLQALERAGHIRSSTEGILLRVIHDSDLGESSAAALAEWKAADKLTRQEWVDEAADHAEYLLRSRVNVTTTTRDAYARATKALGRKIAEATGEAATKAVASTERSASKLGKAVKGKGPLLGGAPGHRRLRLDGRRLRGRTSAEPGRELHRRDHREELGQPRPGRWQGHRRHYTARRGAGTTGARDGGRVRLAGGTGRSGSAVGLGDVGDQQGRA
ncbi:SpvB/TcaC N-terminal domain-containing protein [Actinacidiphila glaucinigra]|uniref:SpvB/TcaC N-terminal domain-containing protein n=1 Tax=Actinacidiphila glaucinigra TaxID=235986 RepID=UPI0035DE3411